ncbi:MAG: hypothetical protein IE886_06180, partial [Campylobacterales bacterium]|nr:hypothetical protein [Campylobacterales bacterium]
MALVPRIFFELELLAVEAVPDDDDVAAGAVAVDGHAVELADVRTADLVLRPRNHRVDVAVGQHQFALLQFQPVPLGLRLEGVGLLEVECFLEVDDQQVCFAGGVRLFDGVVDPAAAEELLAPGNARASRLAVVVEHIPRLIIRERKLQRCDPA